MKTFKRLRQINMLAREKINKHSVFFLQAPYVILFVLFIIVPILVAIGLSFTDFNTIQTPNFVGLRNYVTILSEDSDFMEHALPNTITFSVIVGAGGYILSFFVAWSLAQITRIPRSILAIIMYSPSMTSGIMLTTIWQVVFNNDKVGYLNALLLKWNVIQAPIQFLSSSDYILGIMILVSLWSSMGIGFLAMLAGILNVDKDLYEAAYIDGIKNRWQEIIYITIPQAKPQMMFGMVMAIVNTFQIGSVGVLLTGANPTPGRAGQLIVTHAEEFAFIRYEMGYGAALSVVLLLIIWLASKLCKKILKSDD